MEEEKKREKVVYLFGAGATQAEISLVDPTNRVLMNDVREGILKQIDSNREIKDKFPEAVINELSSDSLDVEHLITLYETSGSDKYFQIARLLRKLFLQEIQGKLKKLGSGFSPKLYPALIDLHEVAGLNEDIAGILTLNYEDLLERGVQKIKNGIDYSIRMISDHSFLKIKNDFGFPILKLHGSFNWKNESPIRLTDDDKLKAEDVLWIPPGVEKRRGKLPFQYSVG